MDVEEFGKLFDSFERGAFRLETRSFYAVDEEREHFNRYLNGEARPDDFNAEWIELVREATAQGKSIERVHVVPGELTPYLRFEIEWGYLHSARVGERILLLDERNANLISEPHQDFWLFDDETVVLMDYDEHGAFLGVRGADSTEVPRFLEARRVALQRAEPLPVYLARTNRD